MTDVWRCPDCGCLALAWSHAHARWCSYGTTPEHEAALVALDHDDRVRTA